MIKSTDPDLPGMLAPGDASAPVKTLLSSELLADQTEIQIVHEQRVYRLRKTANGKLILTR